MTDATADLLASAPAPAPAPASAPAAAPASPNMPLDSPGVVPAQAANDWAWDKYAKDEDLGWLQTKGYKGPEDLIKAARNSEKLIGHDKVPLPKDEADAEGWGRVFDKLGRPKSATEYKLSLPENADAAYVGEMTKTMYAAGLSQRQAEALTKSTVAFQQAQIQAQETARIAKDTQEVAALKAEWGMAWDQQLEIARRGAAEFGIDDAARQKLYAAMGQSAAVKLLNQIGLRLTEAQRVGGDANNTFGAKTPAQAKYEIGQLALDKPFMDAYMDRNHPGHAAALEKMTRLQNEASPQ